MLKDKTHVAYDKVDQKINMYPIYYLSFQYNKPKVDFITSTKHEHYCNGIPFSSCYKIQYVFWNMSI